MPAPTQQQIVDAFTKSLHEQIETFEGDCYTEVEEEEFEHKWRDGSTQIEWEDEETGEFHTFEIAAKVEIVGHRIEPAR